jgi:hypothetical protein
MAEDRHEGEENVLDVELDPEPETAPAPAHDQVLDVVLDDLDDEAPAAGEPAASAAGEPATPPAAEADDGGLPSVDAAPPTLDGSLPAVDAQTIAEANADQLEAVCAYSRQPFEVTAAPEGKGDYEILGAKPLPPGTPVGVPPGRGKELSGIFHLAKYGGCPHCGSSGLLLCQECGSISCGATDKKSGAFLPCPVCGNKGQVVQSKGGWTVSVAGKGKGKGEGKGKGA